MDSQTHISTAPPKPAGAGCANEVGFDYRGPDGNQDLPGMPLANIASVDECSTRCTYEHKCEYYVYVHSTKVCYLKKNFQKKLKDPNTTSGTRCGLYSPSALYNILSVCVCVV